MQTDGVWSEVCEFRIEAKRGNNQFKMPALSCFDIRSVAFQPENENATCL